MNVPLTVGKHDGKLLAIIRTFLPPFWPNVGLVNVGQHKLFTFKETKPAHSSRDLASRPENDIEVLGSSSGEKVSLPTFQTLQTRVYQGKFSM